jgi:hypothetical protein
LVFALANPGKSQLCKHKLCPHGAGCDFVHLKEQPGSLAAVSAKPTAGGAMLYLKDGTSVPILDLVPTQGLVFALANPGKSQLCKHTPCPHGLDCTDVHVSSTRLATAGAIDVGRNALERVRGVLWNLWREISRQLERNPSEALMTDLLQLYQDIGRRLAAVDTRLSTTTTTSRGLDIGDLAEKKRQ